MLQGSTLKRTLIDPALDRVVALVVTSVQAEGVLRAARPLGAIGRLATR